MSINDPKTTNAWAMYDWANSSYALVVNTAIFPLYFAAITAGQKISFLGSEFEPKALFGFSLTFSFFIVLLLSPILSALADTRGNKLSFLKFFCGLGSLSCMGLFFTAKLDTIVLCLFLNICASIGFYGSLVFYNAYLPEIASKDKQDALSAKGFSLGYAGSLLILSFCLFLIQVIANEESRGFYTRLSFLLTGFWWLGFAQYSFARLPRNASKLDEPVKLLIFDAFKGLRHTARTLFKTPNLNTFLGAFFFYSVGMQTIFMMATFIGDEIGLATGKMIMTILFLQIEAICGALLLSRLSRVIGNRAVLMLAVVLWIVACTSIYAIDKTDANVEYKFYGIAALVGLVMGGLQSLSRSTYSKLLPPTDEPTTFFSFYDVLEKAAIIVGTFSYSLLIEKTGLVKPSALLMAAFFAVGLLFLWRLKNSPELNSKD